MTAPESTADEICIDGTIIVGLGGIGSAAAWHLASRGGRVLGLDPRPPGHRDGSSHGRTRLVRQAYFEDPAYVPLAARAWQLWHDLETVSGTRLLTPSGVLALGPVGDPLRLVADTLAAGRLHGLPVEHLDGPEIRQRFPAIHVEDGWEGAFEQDAGFVDPEATVREHHRLALEAGAEFRAETVIAVEPGDRPLVRTDRAAYRSDRVVVAAGPWAPALLASAGVDVRARRKTVSHFAPVDPTEVGPDRLPGFAISDGTHLYYGFPHLDGQGVKIGRHDGGETCTPETIDRAVRPAEVDELHSVLSRFLPAASGAETESYTCLYTMSADDDFIVGALADAPNCIVATGCSGHAFKFVPVLGEILADLALGTAPSFDLRFLSPERSAARVSA